MNKLRARPSEAVNEARRALRGSPAGLLGGIRACVDTMRIHGPGRPEHVAEIETSPVSGLTHLLKVLGILGLLFACTQAAFLGLVLWAAAVPNADIAAQLRNAYATGQLTTIDGPKTSLGNVVDKFSECGGLSTGLADAGFPGRLRNALADGTVAGCVPLQRLVLGYSTPAARVGYPYFRYWHGYDVLDRPLVAWFGLAATRTVVTALLIVSLVFFTVMIAAAARWPASAALVAPLLLTTDFADLPQSLNHAISMSALLVGAASVVAIVIRKGPRLHWLAAAALLSGALYSYVDVLTNPPLALGLTVAGAALASHRILPARGRLSSLTLISLVAGTAWLAGYALTWASKWIVSAVLFGPSVVLQDVGSQISVRLDNPMNGGLNLSLGAATRLNVHVWLRNPIREGVILVCVGLAIVLIVVVMARYRAVRLRDAGLLFAPGLLPIFWFEVVRNHSVIHAWFTYRSLALTLGLAIAAAASVAFRAEEDTLYDGCSLARLAANSFSSRDLGPWL